MLTRRHLRIKVLQNLYAWYQAEEESLMKGERSLFHSVEKLYELYLLFLALPLELKHQAELRMEENKNKYLPSKEDLDPNLKFVQNPVIENLQNSVRLRNALEKSKVSWANQTELVKKIFQDITQSEHYEEFMKNPANDIEFHKKFIVTYFTHFVANSELVQSFVEEENVFWQDDLDLAAASFIKTVQSIKEGKEPELLPLWKNKVEDEEFTKDLFTKCISKRSQTDAWVKSKTDNWELERIASLDLIIMNMAITEAIIFPSIPVKVSLNEYIDLAKEYSTPKSGTFVNGILDKVYAELKSNGTIVKTGRGLVG
ncbi:MAG TPA: transcription antitermination factor NusB [Flavobacteriales bacterium]|nr:transcription antitermination factor NusB [Flavobacteriales bacterium]